MFPNALAEFIYLRTYSRWLEAEQRRERWDETVDRYVGFMRERLGSRLHPEEYAEIRSAIFELKVMPSMRLLWSAGAAVRATQVAAYNCAYLAPETAADLGEIMYLLMCGTGVGFSVEARHVERFPKVQEQHGPNLPAHVVQDTREGWCEALKHGLAAWFAGRDLDFDYSRIRPAGARLVTMGGRASGPESLRSLLAYARGRILARQGQNLRSIDLHDLICRIGEVVMMGGVRRSALLSLSDLHDVEMREAKVGPFFQRHPERSLANNSVAYERKPAAAEFLEEWLALAKGGTGERGIFNRGGLAAQLPARRWPVVAAESDAMGTNPCGEVILRSKQFCNLSEAVARPDDTRETLAAKVRLAAILGTYQATFTDFPYLSDEWRRHCEEERLLGVSLTGVWDAKIARDPDVLRHLREVALATNREYARRLGTNPSAAVTCIKPSGTVSLLVDAASGMHPRFAPYYVRRVRIAATDPLFAMLKAQGFPYRPEVGQAEGAASTYVLEFPMRAPAGAVVRSELDALTELEHWRLFKRAYTEHNPSVTIDVGPGEWLAAAHWLYENWEIVGGLSFLPRGGGSYQLAPYEEISRAEYEARLARLPRIDAAALVQFEHGDHTTGANIPECGGRTCELDPE